MKRMFLGLLILVFAGVLVAIGVAWARPTWLPPWARIEFDRLASWANLGGGDPASPGAPDVEEAEEEPVAKDGGEWQRVIRLRSAQVARRFGVETAPVARERHAHRLTGNAETTFDGRRMAEVLSRVSGVLREVRVDLGQVVGRGDVLAVVESAQVGTAKVQYHTAREAV